MGEAEWAGLEWTVRKRKRRLAGKEGERRPHESSHDEVDSAGAQAREYGLAGSGDWRAI